MFNLKNPTNFSAETIPDLSNKTILVTGGNTGIGYCTVLELARKGANVYLAARSEDKANEAIRKIKEEIKDAKVSFLKLDLMDLKQVQKSAKEFIAKEPVLDILINNAGIMAPPFGFTKDGIESQFGTNHVGHFLFTRELLPTILKSTEPRIVNLSSSAHRQAPKEGILFDKINDESALTNFGRYAQSKVANILFSRELNKRYGDKIYVNSVMPGGVDTDLGRHFKESLGFWSYPLLPFIYLVRNFVLLTPQEGALTSLYCATSSDIVRGNKKGLYYVPYANEEDPIPISRSDEMAEKLWSFTEDLVNEKLKPKFPA